MDLRVKTAPWESYTGYRCWPTELRVSRHPIVPVPGLNQALCADTGKRLRYFIKGFCSESFFDIESVPKNKKP
jgi:hypothetical protein